MNMDAKASEFSPAVSASGAALENSIVLDTDVYSSGPGIFTNVAGRPISIDTAIADYGVCAGETVTLDDLTLALPAKLSDIVTVLRRYGVVVLPGILQGEALESLRRDFTAMVGDTDRLAKQFSIDKDDSNTCIRVQRLKMQPGLAPDVAQFYASPLMATIAAHYFGHEDFQLNGQIFVHETKPTIAPLSGALHFDVSRTLKFWVYLDEGRADTGAIRMSPGTNLFLAKVREEFSERLIPKAQIVNQVDEIKHPAMSIEAPAGSLVIFTTDTAHGAGQVSTGRVRRIMRGHTVETKYLDRSRKRALA